MPRKKSTGQGKVTRYTYDEFLEPRTPETGHTSLIPSDEEHVVVEMDPAQDPELHWAGKKRQKTVPVLPLQRNEIVSESRIAQIVDRVRNAAEGAERQQNLFANLERELREDDRERRVEFYAHEEGWKNKLICGDSLLVMQSLISYEGLRGKVQMVYFDPPYGIKYDGNFQQRIDSTKNDQSDTADDVLSVRAYQDTWELGVHSYLSHLQERLYVVRELLHDSGSVFVQIGDDNVHLVRCVLDEVLGRQNFVSLITFAKTSGKSGLGLDTVTDYILWYAKDKESLKYFQLYRPKPEHTLREQYTLLDLPGGEVRRMSKEELAGVVALPAGAKRFMPDQLTSQGYTESGSQPYAYEGVDYSIPPNTHWKLKTAGLDRLVQLGRVHPIGKRLRYKRYADDFPVTTYSNVWDDTVISGFADPKRFVVQTSPKVVTRCIHMTTEPGDVVLDISCGSGTTAYCAEAAGRRWVTCDTSRVAINVARQRLLAATYDHYKTVEPGRIATGFRYEQVSRITPSSLAYDMEPGKIDLVDQPERDRTALRVAGPFEIMTVGRYSADDWRGYAVAPAAGVSEAGATLENYVTVVARLYRQEAATQGASGFVHAIAEDGDGAIAISVGPISGRVTAKQITEAVDDSLAAGLTEVHVLGWAFEPNVGEVKSRIEEDGRASVELVMIRPDSLVDGLKVVPRDQLFSPLGLPDVAVAVAGSGKRARALVTLKGIAIFDRKKRSTRYFKADSGYVSAWYLDEDYDGDCFVDCQSFFDFKKAPNLSPALRGKVATREFKLTFESEPFPPRRHRTVAVKVVDVYGNESTVVREIP